MISHANPSATTTTTTRPAVVGNRPLPARDDGRERLIRYGGAFSDLLIERAEGSWLSTTDGRRVLDFTSGQMCATLGHGHPAVLEAMRDAAGRVVHLFSGFLCTDVTELARELMAVLPEPLSRAMFLSTGGESTEAALRLAKLTTGGHEVLAFAGSWHGMTAGASSSTYSAGRRGYGPALPGTMALPTPNPYRCPIAHCSDSCDLSCLEAGIALADAQSVGQPAAVIVEPILSAGGIVPLPNGHLARLKQCCEERGMLLIVDEAQTALGRVGTLFAFEQHDVVPDLVALSKTLGGGLPLSATVTTDAIEQDAFDKGFLHVTSHVSDPLPAAVGRAVLRTVVAEDLAARAVTIGGRLRSGLHELQQRHEPIGDVRGVGLILGVDLVTDRDSRTPDVRYGTAVTERCLELGLSVNIVKFAGLGGVLRIAPPLTVTAEEIDLGLEILDQALTDCRRTPAATP
jgi:2,2-dialkylglycine decarboxylase (pyruvate)